MAKPWKGGRPQLVGDEDARRFLVRRKFSNEWRDYLAGRPRRGHRDGGPNAAFDGTEIGAVIADENAAARAEALKAAVTDDDLLETGLADYVEID